MTPWAPLIGLLVLAALTGGAYWQGRQDGSASVQAKWSAATAAQVADQLAASERNRTTETALQAKVKKAADALQTEKARNDRIAAGLRADADRLRNDIAEFAGGGPNDSLAACRADASTIGNVLERALSAHAVCSGHAEEEAATARGLLAAWPVTP